MISALRELKPMGRVLTPTMLTAMFKQEDVDFSYLQQALTTVYAQRGDETAAFLEKILAGVPKKQADVLRTLNAQVQSRRFLPHG